MYKLRQLTAGAGVLAVPVITEYADIDEMLARQDDVAPEQLEIVTSQETLTDWQPIFVARRHSTSAAGLTSALGIGSSPAAASRDAGAGFGLRIYRRHGNKNRGWSTDEELMAEYGAAGNPVPI